MAAALRVDDTAVRDREHPRAEPGLVAVEAVERACDVEERLTEHVLGILDTTAAGEAEQRDLEVVEERTPGGVLAHAGTSERRTERRAEHRGPPSTVPSSRTPRR